MNPLPAVLLLSLVVSPHQAHLNATLARAAAIGDTRKAAIQLRNGADVNTLTLLGQRPLELAVEYRHLETMRLLLDHGALVNSASGFGTPLYWAAFDRDVTSAELLLDRGAWVDYGGQNSPPLAAVLLRFDRSQQQSLNVSGEYVEILPHTPHNRHLAQLIEEKDEEQETGQFVGFSPKATKQRHINSLQIARLLLAHGANANRKGDGGSTPLMDASLAGNTDAAKLLVEHGAVIDAKDEQGTTALYEAAGAAALSGKTDLVEFLLAHGANPNIQSKSGQTALSEAVEGQNLETIKILLAHGANPNLTPLAYSINRNLPPQPGETILARAKEYGDPKIIEVLENAGAK